MRRKERLDRLLVERGLAESRQRAQALILAGCIWVGDKRVDKPGSLVSFDQEITIKASDSLYVSRGGKKLEHALEAFKIQIEGRTCIDVGAGTGGFTDCLLKKGAKFVYAVDVGYGQLHPRIRQDSRVRVLEKTNIRYLEPAVFDQVPELATVDVSFISLELVLPVAVRLISPNGELVALIKPQFEVGKGRVGRKGVVRDPQLHREVISKVAKLARGLGLRVKGLVPSPLPGPRGNREFFIHLVREGEEGDIEELMEGIFSSNERPIKKHE